MNDKLPIKHSVEANLVDSSHISSLHTQISGFIDHARQNVQRVIGKEMLKAYWKIGQLIVLEEQKGESRAKYGDYLTKELSERLIKNHGKGFSETNIRNMPQFYIEYR